MHKINGKNYIIKPNLYQFEKITSLLSSMDIDLEVIKKLIDGESEVKESEIINYLLTIIGVLLSTGKLRELLSYILTPENETFTDEVYQDNLEMTKNIEIAQIKEIITGFFSSTLISLTEFFQSLNGYMQKN